MFLSCITVDKFMQVDKPRDAAEREPHHPCARERGVTDGPSMLERAAEAKCMPTMNPPVANYARKAMGPSPPTFCNRLCRQGGGGGEIPPKLELCLFIPKPLANTRYFEVALQMLDPWAIKVRPDAYARPLPQHNTTKGADQAPVCCVCLETNDTTVKAPPIATMVATTIPPSEAPPHHRHTPQQQQLAKTMISMHFWSSTNFAAGTMIKLRS